MIKYKPITSAMRHRFLVNKRGLDKGSTFSLNKVDSKEDLYYIPGEVINLLHSRGKSAFIGAIGYYSIVFRKIRATSCLKLNTCRYVGTNKEIVSMEGNRLSLKNIKKGLPICNLEIVPNSSSKLCRSAGTWGKVLGGVVLGFEGYLKVRLRSGEVRLISENCLATVGRISNVKHSDSKYGKAGYLKYLGRRPHVRGVAMNPVDHPHGGGEGKTSGGRHPVTPKGFITRGVKTVPKKSKWVLISR